MSTLMCYDPFKSALGAAGANFRRISLCEPRSERNVHDPQRRVPPLGYSQLAFACVGANGRRYACSWRPDGGCISSVLHGITRCPSVPAAMRLGGTRIAAAGPSRAT